ncbi:MAG TPA: SLBB domain-containing protein, partial [Longimicrobiales bacterium]|nr:SLBB domain-containing protein [Longimicrobiales bacterium]
MRRAILVLGALAAFAGGVSAQTAAQEVIRERTGQQLTQEQILQRLQRSGLTRSQVRNRLTQMGLDPTLADPYFDRLEARGAGAELPEPRSEFIQALVRMGLLEPGTPVGLSPDSVTPGSLNVLRDSVTVPVDTALGLRPDSMAPWSDLPIFGKTVFARRTSQFQPLLTGPVPPDYRLGPGDELSLVLTGDVELAYTLPVSREGTVVIPDVGQVVVNGLTLGDLEDRLYDRLGQVYSGVRRGPNATTRFQASLGRLRLNEVFVIGEVEYPGAYQVSSLATVLGALYQAGGPTPEGSFRSVRVRRGGEVVADIDLYEYLLAADTRSDIRLEQGDVVFVPLAGPRVSVRGAVPRSAVFELSASETLADLMGFVGGAEPEADLTRIRIYRILAPEERTEGRQRVLLDVDLPEILASDDVVPLNAGDAVLVPQIGTEQKDLVTIAGSVYRPGPFGLESGMTVW